MVNFLKLILMILHKLMCLKDASSAAIYGAKAAAGPMSLISQQRKVRRVSRLLMKVLIFRFPRKSDYRDYFDAAGYLKFHQDWRKICYTYGQGEDGLYDYYQAKKMVVVICYIQLVIMMTPVP